MDIRIQRLISYIEEQHHRPLSLRLMASVTGLSSSRLRHKFKAEVGVTPTVFLQALRLEKAKELLTTNNLTVKEVKAAVGISSDSYFTHQFKRTFGNPPSHFRRYTEESDIAAENVALAQNKKFNRDSHIEQLIATSSKEIVLPSDWVPS